jgi:N-dimethylarginine dimethylaminohydrolase
MAELGVWSCNEWDPVEEVILGVACNAQFPTPDASTRAIVYPDLQPEDLPDGPVGSKLIEETTEDLERFRDALANEGVIIKRPTPWRHNASFSTINWRAHGLHNYCPRDTILIIGDLIIEAPCPLRSRYFETASYRELLLENLQRGARWISAPRPLLLDELYDLCASNAECLPNTEVLFDAANILRLGRDVLYLVSRTANRLGAIWLQNILGAAFRVHTVPNVYAGSHIDSTFVALRPGLMLCNPARVNDQNLPPFLKEWEILYSPEMELPTQSDPSTTSRMLGSDWIDMNLFSVRPDLVVMESRQLPLIRMLESRGINVLPLQLRHSRQLGGGFHCVTLDVRRRGALESYFET